MPGPPLTVSSPAPGISQSLHPKPPSYPFKSKSTIAVYMSAVDRFADYLDANGIPIMVASLARDHVESFIAYLLERSNLRPRPIAIAPCRRSFAGSNHVEISGVPPTPQRSRSGLPNTVR
jgi:hypothetical protein